MIRAGLMPLAASLLVGLAGCKQTPTSILLTVEGAAGLPPLDELQLSVFVATGVAIENRRLPEFGPPQLPDDVVLFPRESEGDVYILVRAWVASASVGEGATTVELRPGEQVRATVTVSPGALPDRDGDGVPDVIDGCPDLPNPKQGPCGGADAGDGGLDRGPDALPDLASDIPICDKDKDGHLALACGGLDCDDTDPDVHPGASEGPPKDPSCQDGEDNDCDGATDLADSGCTGCNADSECNDNNVCTEDRCTGNHCSNTATNEGQGCNDGNACTTGETCSLGLCGGGKPVSCPPPTNPCQQAGCDPQQGCVTTSKPNGTGCDDGQYCTVADACAGGVCQGDPRDCSSGVPVCNQGSCSETQDACVTSPLANGTSCDDGDPCTQGESCQKGGCTPPPLLTEDVDALDVGFRNDRALAVDSQGKLHTAYRDQAGGQLKHAGGFSGAWKVEVVDASSTDTGWWAAIAVDANDTVHIVYTDRAAGNTRLAWRPAGAAAWQTKTVDGGAGHNAIAVDANGKLHISYAKLDKLHYASGTPAQLTTAMVDDVTINSDNVGYHSSLAIDSSGVVHIAHGRGTTTVGSSGLPWDQVHQLRYSTNAGGSWNTTTPAAGTGLGPHGGFASVAVGGGDIYITHTDTTLYSATQGELFLTRRAGGTWSTETVGSGTFSSLLLDGKQRPHVAYRDPAAAVLKHAVPGTGGTWLLTTIESMGATTGGWVAIARATSGTIHVTYEVGTSKLRHAAFSACP